MVYKPIDVEALMRELEAVDPESWNKMPDENPWGTAFRLIDGKVCVCGACESTATCLIRLRQK